MKKEKGLSREDKEINKKQKNTLKLIFHYNCNESMKKKKRMKTRNKVWTTYHTRNVQNSSRKHLKRALVFTFWKHMKYYTLQLRFNDVLVCISFVLSSYKKEEYTLKEKYSKSKK